MHFSTTTISQNGSRDCNAYTLPTNVYQKVNLRGSSLHPLFSHAPTVLIFDALHTHSVCLNPLVYPWAAAVRLSVSRRSFPGIFAVNPSRAFVCPPVCHEICKLVYIRTYILVHVHLYFEYTFQTSFAL